MISTRAQKLVDKLSDKIIVFDLDGVLCPFRFGDTKCFAASDEEWDIYCAMKEDAYRYVKGIPVMQEIVENLNPRNVYVLSCVTNSYEANSKRAFIEREYPSIEVNNIQFASTRVGKLDMLGVLILKRCQAKDDCILIEDDLKTIQLAEDSNISCMHISEFV